MPSTARYGEWTSPVPSSALVENVVRLAEVRVDDDDVYWLESRPTEGGRSVVVKNGADVIPPEMSARTTVHEYGGGAYAVDRGRVFFSNFDDQRAYVTDGGTPTAITPEPGSKWMLRYADFDVSPDGARIACVRETHNGPHATDVVNEIVVLAPDGGGAAAEVVATGRDFYASPRWSPDGSKLAWLEWDHPNMPWDGTELRVDGELVAGGPDESVVQPVWSPDGVLHFASDRTGWWNLYRAGADAPIVARDAEFASALWVFGLSWYAFLADGRIACTWDEAGVAHLGVVDGGTLTEIDTEYTTFDYLTARGDRVVAVAASPWEADAVVEIGTDGASTVIKRSRESTLAREHISVAEPIEFPTTGGHTAHALYYAPTNADVTPVTDERPPLVVISHGGPTSHTTSAFKIAIQYWTTRGIAVVDVNYGGSTGYSREYRERLAGTWGVVDVDDCINAARFLAGRGDVDPDRFLIRGGSAGGYTTLCTLVFRDDVAAGASYYGVADAEALARDTHKFESRYLDKLIGPYPAARDTYVERSPIHFADQVSCPVILFQGLEDAVVPPSQAEVFVSALRDKGLPFAYVAYEGEQHGFRKAENITDSIDSELAFYARVLGFDPPGPLPDVAIENLGSAS